MKLISGAECVRRLRQAGVFKGKESYFSQLVQKGVIPYHNKEASPKKWYVLDEVKKALKEWEDPRRDAQREANEKRRSDAKVIRDMSEKEKQLMLQKQREKLDELQAEAEKLGVDKEQLDDLEKMDMKALNKAILQQELRIKRAKADESEKKSVPVEYIQETAFEAARITRDGLLGIPTRLSARMAAESDPHACRVMMESEIIKQLENLSEMFREL